jgi:hypothetical protein
MAAEMLPERIHSPRLEKSAVFPRVDLHGA